MTVPVGRLVEPEAPYLLSPMIYYLYVTLSYHPRWVRKLRLPFAYSTISLIFKVHSSYFSGVTLLLSFQSKSF